MHNMGSNLSLSRNVYCFGKTGLNCVIVLDTKRPWRCIACAKSTAVGGKHITIIVKSIKNVYASRKILFTATAISINDLYVFFSKL